MTRIVMKFGGTSVADTKKIKNAAKKVAREVAMGHEVAVIVSAMSGVTNQLVAYCDEVTDHCDKREYDVVVSSGEQVTAGLMAIALQDLGVHARSWMGWQVPILCSESHGKARIEGIDGTKMMQHLSEGQVGVLAGFQGVSKRDRITTLGRGGSDTSAVALAAAIEADRCDIYTDVDGVYTTDPRITKKAKKLDQVSYEEMLEMASLGARVLQTRSVEMAFKHDIPVQVLSSFDDSIGSDLPGTLVTREEDIMEKQVVNGVTYAKNEAKVTLRSVPDIPGIAAEVFGPLSECDVNVDMIVQNVSPDGKVTDITFTAPETELENALECLNNNEKLKGASIKSEKNIVKISVVGIGMVSHAGVARTMFQTLADKNINIHVISTSEIKISVIIDKEYLELAVRALHTAYGLDSE